MSHSLDRPLPPGNKPITTGCQYCAVGCGYTAFLVPVELEPGGGQSYAASRFITPAMTNTVRYKGVEKRVAVAPDPRCDLNKGNHSVRGGSQGHNLVTAGATDRSTSDRLKSPMVRLADHSLKEITWTDLNRIMAEALRTFIKLVSSTLENLLACRTTSRSKLFKGGCNTYTTTWAGNISTR